MLHVSLVFYLLVCLGIVNRNKMQVLAFSIRQEMMSNATSFPGRLVTSECKYVLHHLVFGQRIQVPTLVQISAAQV